MTKFPSVIFDPVTRTASAGGRRFRAAAFSAEQHHFMTGGSPERDVAGLSAVGCGAVADAGDLDGRRGSEFEEEAVLAATEAEPCQRRFEFFYVALAAGQIAIHAVKNLHGCRGLWPVDRCGLRVTK